MRAQQSITEADLYDPLLQTLGSTRPALHNEAMDGAPGPRLARALIRDATPDDAPAIARIGRDAFAATHRDLIPAELLDAVIEQTYSHDALAHCISSCAAAPDAHFLVAESDGDVRGFLHFDCSGPRPELHRIYIARELTGRGLGAKLLHELDRRLDAGATYVLLVIAGNDGALRFYVREGFREEQVIEAAGFYSRQMGVTFPSGSAPVRGLLLRKTI
jgi:ribosomal protein S18 acetylase RimI-like enzyme